MPDKQFYLDWVRRDADAFLGAVRQGAESVPDVPSCPGWNLTDLLLHLGLVHRLQGTRVRERTREFRSLSDEERRAALALEPPFYEWTEHGAPSNEPIPPQLFTWFQEGVDRLLQGLDAVEPDELIGTWFPPDQTGGFWQRRMAQETAVHRWDAQNAVGEAQPIDSTLARDGVDEVFDVMLPSARRRTEPRPGSGESYHFHRTDGEGEWLVRFQPDDVSITHEHAKADVAARGSASDLLLFLWGRLPREKLAVVGDASLLDRYFELVPPG